MAKGPFGKAIRAKEARKLLKEVGGAKDAELKAEIERILGHSSEPLDEIYRLTDGRVVDISYSNARLYESTEEYRQFLASVQETARRSPQHPLGTRFPSGRDFIDAVGQLAQEVAGKLQIGPEVLNGSVDSLEYVDEAAQRLVGQNLFDDPTILAPIVAYVGEVMREATDGHWKIRTSEFRKGGDSDRWEPVIVGANGREYRPFGIFKALLERGSVWARVEVDLGEFGSLGSRARRHQEAQSPAAGALGTVPEDAYEVTLRYGDGVPRTVRFNRETMIAGFPCRAGTEAGFSRTGELCAATLSEAHSFGRLRFGRGTWVRYRKGQQDGRIGDARLGEDQEIDGLPCSAGTHVSFHPNQHVCGTALASDREIGGIPCAGGKEVSFHKSGRLSVATLAKDHVLIGRKFPRGTWLLFDDKARLVRVFLAEDWEIDAVPGKARTFVEFYANGRMRMVALARSHSVLGQIYAEGTLLSFDEHGGLSYAQPGVTSAP
jgi:hypothetical protein